MKYKHSEINILEWFVVSLKFWRFSSKTSMKLLPQQFNAQFHATLSTKEYKIHLNVIEL